jgi:hypothetical protein
VDDLRAPQRVMTALAQGVPLTLLADLLEPDGPDSRAILAREFVQATWLRTLAYPAPASADDAGRESAAS